MDWINWKLSERPAVALFNSVPAGAYYLRVQGEPLAVDFRDCHGKTSRRVVLQVVVDGLGLREWIVAFSANPRGTFAQLAGIAAQRNGLLAGARLRVQAVKAGMARRYIVSDEVA